jgi:uncharacterized protein YjhX (UPF0386 family)
MQILWRYLWKECIMSTKIQRNTVTHKSVVCISERNYYFEKAGIHEDSKCIMLWGSQTCYATNKCYADEALARQSVLVKNHMSSVTDRIRLKKHVWANPGEPGRIHKAGLRRGQMGRNP